MSGSAPAPQRAPRIPFARAVEVRFEEFDEFVTEYARDLSLNGMFLHTNRPHPPGSSFQFEFEIEGGQPLIRGFGEVVWTRDPAGSDQEPAGMGVRFVSLDSGSRRLVRWLLERNPSANSPGVEAGSANPDLTTC